jgi:hypothetical protein
MSWSRGVEVAGDRRNHLGCDMESVHGHGVLGSWNVSLFKLVQVRFFRAAVHVDLMYNLSSC